jgi:hypothetical protein
MTHATERALVEEAAQMIEARASGVAQPAASRAAP